MTPPPAACDPAAATATARVVVTRGGEPDALELAALALALTPGSPAAAPAGAGAPPAWAQAALLAGAGGPVAVRPADLEVGLRRMR